MSSSNPMGLAVTNSIDEPNGLSSIGLASGGFIPNFADESEIPSGKELARLKKTQSLGSYVPKLEIISDEDLFNRYKNKTTWHTRLWSCLSSFSISTL